MAATDLLTLEEAREALGIGRGDTSMDTMLGIAVEAVTTAIVDRCGPVVSSGTIVEEHNGGMPWVYLRNAPVRSITEVVEYDGTTAATLTAETNTSKPGNAYKLDAARNSGKLWRRSGGASYFYPVGLGNVVVTYTPGRCDAGTIPAVFQQAAVAVLTNWWAMYERSADTYGDFDVPRSRFPRFAFPNSAKQLLGREWRRGSGTGDV